MKYFYKVLRFDSEDYYDGFSLISQSCPMDYDDFLICYTSVKRQYRDCDDILIQGLCINSYGREFPIGS